MVKTFKDPEFHKEYNKLVGEEPTPVMPEEMERLVKELPRDPEIVELFKKINAAGFKTRRCSRFAISFPLEFHPAVSSPD